MKRSSTGLAILAAAVLALACSSPARSPTPTLDQLPLQAALSPTALPTVPPLPTPVLSPTPTTEVLIVAKTDGEGLSIRDAPATGDRLKTWPEGTELLDLQDEQEVSGRTWKRVRDPDGREGWAAADFLVDRATFATLPVVTAAPPPPPPPTAVPTQAAPTATFPPLRPTFTPRAAAPTATTPAKPNTVAPQSTPTPGRR